MLSDQVLESQPQSLCFVLEVLSGSLRFLWHISKLAEHVSQSQSLQVEQPPQIVCFHAQ